MATSMNDQHIDATIGKQITANSNTELNPVNENLPYLVAADNAKLDFF
jgi:hypothetical protein